MKTNTILALCLFGMVVPLTRAQYSTPIAQNQITLIQNMEEGTPLPLEKREKEDDVMDISQTFLRMKFQNTTEAKFD